MTAEGIEGVAAAVERRIVTVLFADLVDFTSLSERLDAEDVASIQDAYFAAVRETIGRYGGELEKFIGDAAMAVFGVPRARDDDAERAVRAGLALVAAVAQLGARLGLDEGELRVRVGVTTGEVVHAVEGPDAGRVTGDTVNTAARLQAAADPGTVLIGEDTALAVAEAIETAGGAPLTLKGKAAPVRAWRAVGLRVQRSRAVAMGSLRAPTIGRDRELEALMADVAAVAATRSTLRRFLIAPPGVGKTRVVEELVRRAESMPERPTISRVRLRPEGTGSFDPLVPIAIAAATSAGVALEERAVAERLAARGLPSARANVVAAELADLAATSPRAAGARSGPSGVTVADRDARFEAWLEAVDVLVERPQLWVVEDVHWASDDVLAFLDAAAARPARSGRLILATARPAILERLGPRGAADESILELATLAPVDAATLVRSLVGDALPSDLVETIAERSDGNCLFIEELLRTWVGTGALVEIEPSGGATRSAGGAITGMGASPPTVGDEAEPSSRWRLTVSAGQIPLPASVQAIYAAQLDDLPGPARQAARRGSVAGRRFPLRAMRALGVPGAGAAVDELKRRALVAGPQDEPLTGEVFAYRHALLRDAGYASLARAERADLHVRLAAWLESAAGVDADVLAGRIGEHLALAVESAPALARDVVPGRSRSDVARDAARWLERGAARAATDGALGTAATLLRRAVALTDDGDGADLARRLVALGRSLTPVGGLDEADDAFARAMDAARSARDGGDDRWRVGYADAAEARCGLLFERLRFVDAWHLGDAALEELGDDDDLPAARVRLARSRGRTGETNDASGWIADADRAVAAAVAAGDEDAEYGFRRDRLAARSEGGLADAEEWVAFRPLAEARGDVGATVSARLMEAAYRAGTDPRAALAILDPARGLAVARGLVERLGWVHHATAEAALGSGDWDLVLEAGMEGVELGERHGYDRIAVRSWSTVLPVASLRGDRAVLDHAMRWFAERADRLPDSPYGRVLYAGAEAWIATAGRARPPSDGGPPDGAPDGPEIDHLRPAFPLWLAEGRFEWAAATDAIADAWFGAGRLEWLETLVDAAAAADLPPDAPDLTVGAAFEIVGARLGLARGTTTPDEAATTIRGAISPLRAAGIAFWTARGLRILDGIERASPAERDEMVAIEARLGLVRPALVLEPTSG